MNRLILIGNGFDLAHGLKTSYNDFIRWYIAQAFDTAYEKGSYKDALLQIGRNHPHGELTVGNGRVTIPEYLDFFYEKGFKKLLYNHTPFDRAIMHYQHFFTVKLESQLFEKLLTECIDANWVDIKNEFYEQLKDILELDLNKRKDGLLLLNQSLFDIIEQLEKYLKTLKSDKYNGDYGLILKMDIQNSELIQPILEKDELPKETHILNFNYTSTIENYLPKHEIAIKKSNVSVNYIHGKLGSKRNP